MIRTSESGMEQMEQMEQIERCAVCDEPFNVTLELIDCCGEKRCQPCHREHLHSVLASDVEKARYTKEC